MSKPIIKLVNAETGEEIEREMNNDEFAQHQADLQEAIDKQNYKAEKEASKAALLIKLGITADEAALLLS